MSFVSRLLAPVLAAAAVTGGVAACGPTAPSFTNCTAMHAQYRHGVGLPGAVDHTRSGTGAVTTFYRSADIYQANTRLDADHDGVACEQK